MERFELSNRTNPDFTFLYIYIFITFSINVIKEFGILIKKHVRNERLHFKTHSPIFLSR